jgi:nucleotide-binding universal stress UspA family protein
MHGTATDATARSEGVFSRLVAIHSGDRPDRTLLEHATALAALGPTGEPEIAALPAVAAALSLGEVARSTFAARGLRSASVRTLPAPDVDAILEAARDHRAGLLVMRTPSDRKRGRAIAKRILADSPCAIYFVPPGEIPARFDTVVAGVDVTPASADVLELTCRLASSAGTEEILAVHSRFRETIAADEDAERRFRADSFLRFHRFLRDVPRNGTRLTPVIEECARYSRALLDVVAERGADLVVVGRPPRLRRLSSLKGPAPSLDLLRECPRPVLSVPVYAKPTGVLEALREGLFREPEPAFR